MWKEKPCHQHTSRKYKYPSSRSAMLWGSDFHWKMRVITIMMLKERRLKLLLVHMVFKGNQTKAT